MHVTREEREQRETQYQAHEFLRDVLETFRAVDPAVKRMKNGTLVVVSSENGRAEK